MSFPVDEALPGLASALRENRPVVLQAPPGSGKTTRVAPFLLGASWLEGRKIVMLEPRRLAARMAAGYMAKQRGEGVGETIGYQIRLERRGSSRTRIEIVTEGILVQRLLADPELSDTGLIIFDEFHERGLSADMGLALAMDARSVLRPDLRIVVMSATLDPAPIAAYLGKNTEICTASARLFPVKTLFLKKNPSAPLPSTVTDAVCRALEEEEGSILVFLPGEGEIRSTAERLGERRLPPGVEVHPLYSALEAADQDRAVAPAPYGKRKVVLATSIAESSLTIEGIRVVIDSGWMRVPRFSPKNGMSRLETLRISRDRADQRRGRAGRLAPGICYRLWDETTDRQLVPESLPEILDADMSSTLLQCADWGTTSRTGLPWLTPPPDSAWREASALLLDLKAIERESQAPASPLRITPLGRRLVRFPIHPRLAYALDQATRFGCGNEAALWMAAIAESASFSSFRRETDLRRIMAFIESHPHLPVSQRVRKLASNWRSMLKGGGERRGEPLSPGVILSWAFPERIAKRRNNANGTYLLRSGRGASLEREDPLLGEEWLVAAELQDGSADAKIRLALPLTRSEIEEHFSSSIEVESLTLWDRKSESVHTLIRRKLGALVLSEGDARELDREVAGDILCDVIRQRGVNTLPWSKGALSLRERVSFLHRSLPDTSWPDFTDQGLAERLSDWLKPFIPGLSRWSELQKLDLNSILQSYLNLIGCSRLELDRLAPSHVVVPSGSRIPIRYDAENPYLAVRIQEVFGMNDTPRIAQGRVPVVMQLLSPAQRPVQTTSDLRSFWSTSYAWVRKDLRGRYPKHYWPEDPYQAIPTRRVRPRPSGPGTGK